MKKITFITFSILFIIGFNYFTFTEMEQKNCEKKQHPIFEKFDSIIRKAQKISIFQVDATPILPQQQSLNHKYLNDYLITKEYTLDSLQKSIIQNAVLDTLNYMIDFKKSCPMNAKYGIRFDKGKDYISLIVSDINCEKVIVFSSKPSIHKKYYDLKSGNAIHEFLKSFE